MEREKSVILVPFLFLFESYQFSGCCISTSAYSICCVGELESLINDDQENFLKKLKYAGLNELEYWEKRPENFSKEILLQIRDHSTLMRIIGSNQSEFNEEALKEMHEFYCDHCCFDLYCIGHLFQKPPV